MTTAAARTDEAGLTISGLESEIGLKQSIAGHGISKSRLLEFDSKHERELLVCEIEDINIRTYNMCQFLRDFGYEGKDLITLKDDSAPVKTNRLKKDGTPTKEGRAIAKHYVIDIVYKKSKIRMDRENSDLCFKDSFCFIFTNFFLIHYFSYSLKIFCLTYPFFIYMLSYYYRSIIIE